MIFVFAIFIVAAVAAKDTKNCDNLVNVEDFHTYARETLRPKAIRYIDTYAGYGDTARWNRESFRRIHFKPKLMVNVSKNKLSTTVLGQEISFPVGSSPSAFHGNAHPEAENGTARALASAKTLMIVSVLSTVSMEGIAKAGGPDLIRWQQLQIFPNRSVTLDLLRRAEASGAKAIVLTMDLATAGLRYNYYRDNYYVKPNGSSFGNFERYNNYSLESDPSLTWTDFAWFVKSTRLPVVAKGILTGADAVMAVRLGAKGILVSNHGGRQLDGNPASIDKVYEVSKAVAGRAEVYLDSGIRTGMDVFKALALGARAVFIGKPIQWGLSCQGEIGVKGVLDILNKELDNVMSLAGANDITKIDDSFLQQVRPIDAYQGLKGEVI